MKILLLFAKVFGIAFGIAGGVVLAMCTIYLLSCGVILFIEFIDRKVGKK